MQSITALAHLNACILYFIDISEECGYTIEQQIQLFDNIKPLFQAKPLVLVLTKIDKCKYTDLAKKQQAKIQEVAKLNNAYMIQMSNVSGEGIDEVKTKACDILLDFKLTQKSRDPKKNEAIANRLHIALPKRRDDKERDANIPQSVLMGVKKEGPTVKELQEEFGGAGVFDIPVEEHFMLEKEEWRYDKAPEFYLGKNVADFYDPDIEEKLKKLEEEEEMLVQIDEEGKAAQVESDGSFDEELLKSA